MGATAGVGWWACANFWNQTMNYLTALLCMLSLPAWAANVTSLSIPVGQTRHVTVWQAGVAVAPATITWTSTGDTDIGTIDVDATGFVFAGTAEGTTRATATHAGDGATGTLDVGITPAEGPGPLPPASLTFTSP
jgi:hypothetical protein